MEVLDLVRHPGAMPDKQTIMDAVARLETLYSEETDCAEPITPLRDMIALKGLETFVKEAQKIVMPWAAQEAEKYSEQERRCIYNAKLVIRPGSNEYDYSANSEWQDAKAEEEAYLMQAKMAANRRKAIEDNLRLAGCAKLVKQGQPSVAITIL